MWWGADGPRYATPEAAHASMSDFAAELAVLYKWRAPRDGAPVGLPLRVFLSYAREDISIVRGSLSGFARKASTLRLMRRACCPDSAGRTKSTRQ
jgi:hypothetical protein